MGSTKGKVSQSSPLRWSDVEEMYGGSPDLLNALRALAPLSADEAVALVASHQSVAAAQLPLLPDTDAACVAVRGDAIRRAAARTVATSPHRPRDVVAALYAVVAETGSDDPLAAGWLWGPAGRPVCSERRLSRRMPLRDRWHAHAAVLGATLSDPDCAQFEGASVRHLAVCAEDGSADLDAMAVTVRTAGEALATISACDERDTRQGPLGVLGSSNGNSSALAYSDSAWQAARTLRDCAFSAMAAARSVYVRDAVTAAGLDRQALEAIRAMGWVDAVLERWLSICPQGGSVYSDVRSPTSGQFWLGAFTVARTQIGFAAEGMHGIAKTLVNRP